MVTSHTIYSQTQNMMAQTSKEGH